MVISVNYDEGDASTYENVQLGDRVFRSGNFVKDWYDAKHYYMHHHSESGEPLVQSSSVDYFITDSAEYDSAYLRIIEGAGVLKYPQRHDRDYWEQVQEGWEYFVPKGTKPTWQEFREMCK